MKSKNIAKYLTTYAEPEVDALTSFPRSIHFNHVLVIPAFKEKADFITRFYSSKLAQQQVLMICVINQPDSYSSSHDSNFQQQLLYEQGLSLGKLYWQHENLTLVQVNNGNSWLLLVDRFTKPIPIKQGVGLARKIGADLALSLISHGIVSSHWIYSTDADSHLPDDYFSVMAQANAKTVIGCFNFHHKSENLVLHTANQQYENALRYFVAGLKYANSPYAFFTIGSILVFQAQAYAMVRGFPKRSAGEDFYLLNKLAKIGEVEFFEHISIIIDARNSDRVPFGTGPAVSEIMVLNQNEQVYCYYHPQLFNYLKSCLAAFECLYQYRDNLAVWFDNLPEKVSTVLIEQGLDSFVFKHTKVTKKQFDKQLFVWFDAFRTMKFLHGIRNLGYEDIALEEAIETCLFDTKFIT